MILRAVLFLATMNVSAQSLACTLCHSEVAQEVRDRLFESDFMTNLAMITLPALILFGAIFYAARTPSNAGNAP